jgi:hypothetical protein
LTSRWSEWTYVVELTHRVHAGFTRSPVQLLLEERTYIHGPSVAWPDKPPHSIGFRWDDRLRQINEVETAAEVDDLNRVLDEIDPEKVLGRAVIYQLGPPIRLSPPLPCDGYQGQRPWVPLDALLSASSLADAVTLTDRRLIEGSDRS